VIEQLGQGQHRPRILIRVPSPARPMDRVFDALALAAQDRRGVFAMTARRRHILVQHLGALLLARLGVASLQRVQVLRIGLSHGIVPWCQIWVTLSRESTNAL